jgi:hypothetical protein
MSDEVNGWSWRIENGAGGTVASATGLGPVTPAGSPAEDFVTVFVTSINAASSVCRAANVGGPTRFVVI